MNNTKKIAENLNETTFMFDEYTKSMEEGRATLNEEFINRLDEETSVFNHENRELKEKLEEMRDDSSKNIVKINKELFEAKNELKEEITSLKTENEELKEEDIIMKEKIFSLEKNIMFGGGYSKIGDWKVCA